MLLGNGTHIRMVLLYRKGLNTRNNRNVRRIVNLKNVDYMNQA